MKDLDRHYNSMMTSLDKLTKLTIDILIGLGHTRMSCCRCKRETDIQEVHKNVGYCNVCVVAVRRNDDNRN
jgi:late competence protein required for DNA uptake (superfamily II DNA/RNA helicase)